MPRCPSSARCPPQLGTGRGTLNGARPLAAQQPLPSEPPAGSTSGAVVRRGPSLSNRRQIATVTAPPHPRTTAARYSQSVADPRAWWPGCQIRSESPTDRDTWSGDAQHGGIRSEDSRMAPPSLAAHAGGAQSPHSPRRRGPCSAVWLLGAVQHLSAPFSRQSITWPHRPANQNAGPMIGDS